VRKYPNLTEIPWLAVDAVVEQSWGAYPVSCWGFYWYDVEHLRLWIRAGNEFKKTGKIDPLEEYFNKYVFECESFDDLMSKIPDKRLGKLVELDGHQPIIT
jgi:glutaconate CoA-transferase subunit A